MRQAEALFTTSLVDAMAEGRELLERAKEEHAPCSTFALFSGGNDSTVMSHLVCDLVDAALHINTGTGIPETTRFVRQTCKQLKLPLLEKVTPPEVYEGFVLGTPTAPGLGFPGPSGHNAVYWHLKQRRLREVRKMHGKVIFVTGVRRSESRRRARGSAASRKEGSILWVNPIAHFDQRLMNEYREANPDVPRNRVADLLHRSGECLCGAYARADELKEIELWYPEVGQRIRDLERRAREAGIANCEWGGQGRQRAATPGPLCSDCVTLWEEET